MVKRGFPILLALCGLDAMRVIVAAGADDNLVGGIDPWVVHMIQGSGPRIGPAIGTAG
jgi:hypothetical protein